MQATLRPLSPSSRATVERALGRRARIGRAHIGDHGRCRHCGRRAAAPACGARAGSCSRAWDRPCGRGGRRRPCARPGTPARWLEPAALDQIDRRIEPVGRKTCAGAETVARRSQNPAVAQSPLAAPLRKEQIVDRGRRLFDRADLRHELRGGEYLLRLQRVGVVLVADDARTTSSSVFLVSWAISR